MATFQISRKCFLFIFVINFFLFYCTFLFSFLPMKKNTPDSSKSENIDPVPNQTEIHPRFDAGGVSKTLFSRLVVMVIDSLRADFVIDNLDSHMSYVRKLLGRGDAVGFYAITHPPTVTLPRIKAMMTGNIPGFIDVVFNIGAQAIQEDNLIFQLHRSGKRIVFYGDRTWIDLFPGYFLRQDGTISFFVTDYTEVDTNVSRHLEWELQQQDWDVMVLHYLGLDHIGHMAKPSSPLVKPKLEEMDRNIELIHRKLIEKHGEKPSVMVILGDHGMSDQGSHGGASNKEVTTAMVWLTSASGKHNGRKNPFKSESSVVDQIDITATLAFALGVQIPSNNLGAVIPDIFLQWTSVENLVQAMYINANQVLNVFKENTPNWQNDDGVLLYEATVLRHQLWRNASHMNTTAWYQQGTLLIQQYRNAVKEMGSKILTKMAKYDINGMLFSNINLWLLMYVAVSGILQKGSGAIQVMLSSTSFLLLLLIGMSLLSLHVMVCTSHQQSAVLCSNPLSTIVLVVVSFFSLTLAIGLTPKFLSELKGNLLSTFFQPSTVVLLGSLLHCLSLMSSSFIEEEHQTWYFLTTSLFVFLSFYLLLKLSVRSPVFSCHQKIKPDVYSAESTTYNPECIAYKIPPQNVNSPNELEIHGCTQNHTADLDYKSCIMTMSLVVMCRVQRMWNNTGDKWRDVPDIGDWLMESLNKPLLSMLCAVSLLLILAIRSYQVKSKWHIFLFLVALVYIYLFHAAKDYLLLPPEWLWSVSDNGLTEARVVYSALGLMTLESVLHYSGNFVYENSDSKIRDVCVRTGTLKSSIVCMQSCSILLAALLSSYPYNITIMAIGMVQEAVVSRCVLSTVQLPTWCVALIYAWMAQATYFYQGYSNSLSSIDVAAGFFGLDSYQPILVGGLLTMTTYCGMLFWYTSLVNHVMDSSPQNQLKYRLSTASFSLLMFVTASLPAYTVLVLIERYHLFIWTVFSPKLLFAGMLFLITSLFVIILSLLQTLCFPV